MNTFANVMREMGTMTLTENGGKAFSTTGGGALLDLFANIGGMRGRSDADIISQWRSAYRENPELASNLILYARSIRTGGLGERKIGRILLKQLATYDPEKIIRNFDTIVDCGRWDDLFIFIGTPVEFTMWQYIENQVKADVEGALRNKPISLLAKWLKSENTSSRESREIAKNTRIILHLTSKQYRKMLSKLRKYINVLEAKISRNQWDEINFEQVPSLAMKRYLSAFGKHCYEAFGEYKAKLVKGEAKVNAATLYPYDLVQPYIANNRYGRRDPMDVVTEEQWKALPNYVNENYDVVCVVDTSGSMTINNYRPLSTAVGLGIYFAQHNKGPYHNLYMTFSSNPTIQRIEDNWGLDRCIDYVMASDWGMGTDLDRTFQLIFDIARAYNDAPRAIAVISDMEINTWHGEGDVYARSITEKWDQKFRSIGLKCPKLLYWNIESRHGNTLSKCTENVGYISGSSAGSFKFFTELIEKSAYEAMVSILTKPEFSWK